MHYAPSSRSSRQHQRGFSLIELLISLAIGLVIMAAASAVYVFSGRTSSVSDVSTKLNEDGLLALNIIQQQIKQAGYSQKVVTAPSAGAITANYAGPGVRGCTGGFKDSGSTTKGYAIAYASTTCNSDAAGATSTNDAILVRYEADASNTVPTSTGLPTNCVGASISRTVPPDAFSAKNTPAIAAPAAGATNYALADNRLFLMQSAYANSATTLACAGAAGDSGGAIDTAAAVGAAQPLFENVEQLVFTYGVAAKASPQQLVSYNADFHQIIAYLGAADVDRLPTTASGTAAQLDDRWGRVLSVRICLVARSPAAVADASLPANYTDCHGTSQANNGFLHRRFVTTVMLRNRMVLPVCLNNAATC